MTDSTGWRPLLEGERAGRARRLLALLGARLAEPPAESRSASLFSGLPGIALALAAQGREERAAELLADAVGAIDSLGGELGLSRGLAGLAFALEQIEGASDGVDQALGAEIAARADLPAELMLGLAGRAVYARELAPPRALHAAIGEELAARAEPEGGGLAWRSAPDPRHADRDLCTRYPEGWFDLGVAHGAPAVIAALVASHGERARAGMAWLWRQGGDGRFPAIAGEEPHPQPGWCYGDEGISAVLFAVARALGDQEWEARWLGRLRDAALAAGPSESLGLCHGAAGLGHIHNRVHQATGAAWARAAALAHFDHLVDRLAGSIEALPAGLLEGQAGIALALTAALGDREPAWDRALVLSIRT